MDYWYFGRKVCDTEITKLVCLCHKGKFDAVRPFRSTGGNVFKKQKYCLLLCL